MSDAPETVVEVARLLRDFRILLSYAVLLRGRAGATAGAWLADPKPTEPVGPADDDSHPSVHISLLTMPPERIAGDALSLQRLYSSLDTLSAMAAPASVVSIALTAAFIGRDEQDIPPFVRMRARRLRHWALSTAALGMVLFVATVMLLIHVDRGRRSLQQTEQVRADRASVLGTFAVMRGNPETACPESLPGANGPAPVDPETREQTLCGKLRDLARRSRIIRYELRQWNDASDLASYVSPFRWLEPSPPLPDGLSREQWQSTELRTSALMAGITGFVLPTLLGLLGLLGSFAYVFRKLDQQVRTSTLRVSEGFHGILRMLLGGVLGGLLGVLWTNGQPVQLEGVTMSLSALAFFVGFAVEIVFRTLDAIITGVAGRMRRPNGPNGGDRPSGRISTA